MSGEQAIVGAYLDDDNGYTSGSTYIFARNQGGPDNWGEVSKLTSSDGAADDKFGISVAISGDLAIVGAGYHDDNGDNSGAAYVYKLNFFPEPNDDFVFLTDKSISISRHVTSEGNLHSNDDIQFKAGKSSIHTGNLSAVNRIKIRKKNTINGDIKAGGSVDNDGTINGSIEEGVMVSEIPLPNISFSAGGSNEMVPKNGLFTLAPGSYRNVKVKRGGRLELSHGDYIMKSLNLDRSSVLSIDVSEGAVTINVVGLISFDKNAEVEIVLFGESGTDQVMFNSLSNGSLKFRSGVKLLGSVVAPHAKVSIDKNAYFKGSICARVISIGKGVTFLHHSSTTSLPKVLPLAEDERENVELTSLPTEYALDQNYPNPFNPTTTIKFAVPEAGEISLSIYNLRGQLIQTLYSGPIAAGRHSVVWNGTDSLGLRVASGIYVYRLTAKDFVATRKLAITK